MTLFFTGRDINNLEDVMTSDRERYKSFFGYMLREKIFLPPSQFETWFITPALADDDVGLIVEAFRRAVKMMK
jgi:glutamate-1-semialdehyde 2,1-aminomutase